MKNLSLILWILLMLQPAWADSFKSQLRQGNRAYDQKKYESAAELYQKAEELNPQDARAPFNKGAALYRLGQWDQSKEAFTKTAQFPNADIAAKSFYNLGNAQFQKGEFAQALKAYQQSLRLNPKDAEAKHNLQMAIRLLKNSPQQQKQDQKQEPQKQKSQQQKQSEADLQKKEQQENAKRILKSAEEQNNKPIFNPENKTGKKQNVRDW